MKQIALRLLDAMAPLLTVVLIGVFLIAVSLAFLLLGLAIVDAV